MAIIVVCRNCRKSFQVNEKFAGKSGPCPNCKAVIQVPAAAQQVKVHAPTQFASGGRSISGQLLTKPIARSQVKVKPALGAGIAAAALAALALSWLAGGAIRGSAVVRLVGLLAVSPPLVLAGYAFLRNDEQEPYRSKSLYVRAALCAAGYVALWGAFAYVSSAGLVGELWTWVFVAPPFLAVGALVPMGCLDLDFGNGFSHYAFYVLATLLLRWAAGMPGLWEVPNTFM